jgi:hypothetical protein
MDNPSVSPECKPKDLTGRKAAWFFWYLPILLIIVGSSWNDGRVWLWVPAFLVMGVGCLANQRGAGEPTATSPHLCSFLRLFSWHYRASGWCRYVPVSFSLSSSVHAASRVVPRFRWASTEAELDLCLRPAS